MECRYSIDTLKFGAGKSHAALFPPISMYAAASAKYTAQIMVDLQTRIYVISLIHITGPISSIDRDDDSKRVTSTNNGRLLARIFYTISFAAAS